MSGPNDLNFLYYVVLMGYLVLAKGFFDIPIYDRMRAKTWMKAGCPVLLPSVEDAMF